MSHALRPLIFGAALALLASGEALAAPRIRITPPPQARFAVDQRFDIRVEFSQNTGPITNASVTLDGAPITGTLDANNALTFRRMTLSSPGVHTITATGSDDTGAATASVTLQAIDPAGGRPGARNVIIFLGDGMGAAHRTAARIVRYGVDGGYAKGRLAMDRFPYSGMVNTHSLNSIITDSAPGMANYVTGNKANNNEEGVFPDNTPVPQGAADNTNAFDNPRVEYLAEYLFRKHGKVSGIVSTADVEDATPAANAAHTSNRNAGTGIIDQFFDERGSNGLRVILGGGRRWFLPAGQPGSSRANATDYQLSEATAAALGVPRGALDPARDLITEFTADGWTYAATRTDLLNNAGPNTAKLLGLFAYGNMNVAWDKLAKQRNPGAPGVVDDYLAPDQPMLDEMTRAALNTLNNNAQGFTLMVEAAHIDKQSHLMDADRAIVETIEFDKAIAQARDFAEKRGEFINRPGNAGDTIIIVTADHECSGFSVIGAANRSTADLRNTPAANRKDAVGTYEAAGFPAYAVDEEGYPTDLDPDRKLLIGFGANGDRTEDWLSNPRPIIDSLLPTNLSTDLAGKGYLRSGGTFGPTGTTGAIQRDAATGYFIAGQAPGDQAVHTASDIPLSAYGPGAGQFTGVQDNTDVFFKLLRSSLGGYEETTGTGGSGIQGDVDNSGAIDIRDAVWVLRRIVGLQ